MEIRSIKFIKETSFIKRLKIKIEHLPYRFRNMKRKLKLIKCAINDKDWDYCYIYRLLLVKLENIQEYYTVDRVCESWNGNEQKIKYAIGILRHLTDTTTNSYPVHINTNNIRNYVSEDKLKYYNFHNEDKPFKNSTVSFLSNIEGTELDRINRQEFYDVKARIILFKLLNRYLPYWWD